MNDEHVDDEELEEFVLGALLAERRGGFEAHVNDCPRCAGRLMRQAKLEVALVELARPRQLTTGQRLVRPRWQQIVGLPLAAALALSLVRVWSGHAPAEDGLRIVDVEPVICPDGPGQADCVEVARRAGFLVRYPLVAGSETMGVEGRR